MSFNSDSAPASAAANQSRHNAACRFGWRISQKLRKNRTLADAIDDYLLKFDVVLPAKRDTYRADRATIWQNDLYWDDLANENTMEAQLGELARLRYSLTETRGYYAEFHSDEARRRLVPMAFWYSRHRLCYVWNMRKSQIIRSRYFQFLSEKRDDHGRLLISHYRPAHLVLTVPHDGGVFEGERFYARKLIKRYAELRKTDAWKKYVYAGEYGLEVKRSKKHGLHIHVHSLILQHPQYSMNEVRDALVAEWRELMNNTTKYSGLSYETLYWWEKTDDGKKVKRYVVPGESDLEHYLRGVLECIKYHFKPDCLDDDAHGFDVPLIQEILNSTKGLRMYSRFGKFYKEPSLNFNTIEKAVEDLTEEETADEVKASVDGVEERLINPYTFQQAEPGSYRIKVGRPDSLKYHANTGDRPLEPWYYQQAKCPIYDAPPGLSLKEVIRLDVMGRLFQTVAAVASTDF